MMKRYMVVFCSLVLLSACSPNEQSKQEWSSEVADSTLAIVSSIPSLEPTTTFQGGTLENEEFRLTIEEAELITSPALGTPGLYFTFSLTNKSENEEIIPTETLSWIQLEQKNETSRVVLDAGYHYLDAFGEERYNEMVDKSNATSHYLLPGKTIEFVEAYSLNNKEFPVTLIGLDFVTNEKVGEYTITLGEPSEVQIKTQQENEEVSIEESSDIGIEKNADEEKEQNYQLASDLLSSNGFFLGGTETFLYSQPITSGLSQTLFFSIQSNDEDGFLSSQVYPLFQEASLYFESIEIILHDFNEEVILIAENGEITYSVIN